MTFLFGAVSVGHCLLSCIQFSFLFFTLLTFLKFVIEIHKPVLLQCKTLPVTFLFAIHLNVTILSFILTVTCRGHVCVFLWTMHSVSVCTHFWLSCTGLLTSAARISLSSTRCCLATWCVSASSTCVSYRPLSSVSVLSTRCDVETWCVSASSTCVSCRPLSSVSVLSTRCDVETWCVSVSSTCVSYRPLSSVSVSTRCDVESLETWCVSVSSTCVYCQSLSSVSV